MRVYEAKENSCLLSWCLIKGKSVTPASSVLSLGSGQQRLGRFREWWNQQRPTQGSGRALQGEAKGRERASECLERQLY